ncbi:MAG: mandelate racemase/muconate lactonizing enzyme family protein [Rhodobacteraceae bacterium]|nr:mandelate racemase/muconate lactonizing enzyme family protein [Paracoccaceae bacterium]
MKIADIKTWAVATPPPHKGGAYWIFVKLTTDNGICGYGEVYGVPFAPRLVCDMVEDVAARFVIGRSPFEIETIWRLIYSAGFVQRPDVSTGGVLSGIEIACWDIMGKALNQPVYNLLGGKVHERLRSYTYLYPSEAPDGASAKDFHGDVELAPKRLQHYMDMGFTAVGYDPVMPMGSFDPRQLSLADLERAEKMTREMREVAGSRCDLMIKTHGQMTTSSAIRLARRLEPYDPLWFEEPTPPCNAKEMARVASATTIPISAGERLVSKYEFVDLLQQQAAQILQPALGRVGGILEAKKIAGMAEAHYAQFAPHLFAGPLEAIANIQVSVCTPNFLILESIECFGGFFNELLTRPIRWEEGYVIVSDEPGLGYELNEAMCEANPYTGDDVFPPMAKRPLE